MSIAADEVVQVYVRDLEASTRVANYELRSFGRVTLEPGESKIISRRLTAGDLSLITDEGQRVLEPGEFCIHVGGSQPDARSVALMGQAPLTATATVSGRDPLDLPY